MIFKTKRFLYRAYLAMPFAKYIFIVVRRMWVPPFRFRRWLRFKGVFVVSQPKGSLRMISYGNTIENELFWLGLNGWEPASIRIWSCLATHAKVIMDVGANTGLYSLVAFQANPNASIYAFEPLPMICQRLTENLRLNNARVSVINVALSNQEGEAVIFASETISGTFDQASLRNSKYSDKGRLEFRIRTRRLSDLISELNLNAIDLMKIDVETFEPEVLKGMNDYLSAFRPTMLIEILNSEVGGQVDDLTSGLNYAIYKIAESDEVTRIGSLSVAKPGGNFLFLNTEKHGHLIPEILKKNQNVS